MKTANMKCKTFVIYTNVEDIDEKINDFLKGKKVLQVLQSSARDYTYVTIWYSED